MHALIEAEDSEAVRNDTKRALCFAREISSNIKILLLNRARFIRSNSLAVFELRKLIVKGFVLLICLRLNYELLIH